jgi:hypothetical protein
MEKVQSVLDLSKFKVGQTVYWLVFRPVGTPKISPSSCDPWMRREHPKVFFDRKIMTPLWKSKRRIPKLHASDFYLITQLVTQRPQVEKFTIKKIRRSRHTGEFSYVNQDGDRMPEKFLFVRRSEAIKERSRLQQMLSEWIAGWS